ncbi:hypothetical protein TUBRATIS_18820 [Tubulinosema ratisbonensis]|uniref:Uncharacterized protein n=1 Tax=Tubulinosema ratisbonensis TaxID=291195 RepID=A0A437AKT3_9MICR|nr:hypothetical protein TUBRATIS_18820 [Tubulinosema ratisbonensis]
MKKIKVFSKDWLTLFFQSLRTELKDYILKNEESFSFLKKYVCANVEYGIPENLDPKMYSEIIETEEKLEELTVDLAFLRRNLPKEYQSEFQECVSNLEIKINQLIYENEQLENSKPSDKPIECSFTKEVKTKLNKLSFDMDAVHKKLKKCKRVFGDELRKSLGTYGCEKEDSIVKYFNDL